MAFLLVTNVVSEVRRPRREQNPGKACEIELWLDQVWNAFNILTMDSLAFRCWARPMHQ